MMSPWEALDEAQAALDTSDHSTAIGHLACAVEMAGGSADMMTSEDRETYMRILSLLRGVS